MSSLKFTAGAGGQSVIVRGLDFTSVPKRAKPITCAECTLGPNGLALREIKRLESFQQFEALIPEPGVWVAGFDFPFGQSKKLISNLGWPPDWSEYVGLVGLMKREEFVQLLNEYKEHRLKGDKEHRRATDVQARSVRPQKLNGVPVGKMFFEGAPRILRSGANIIPVRPRDDPRVFLEAYPKLVAKRWSGGSYKVGKAREDTKDRKAARQRIIEGLRSRECEETYGFSTVFDDQLARRMLDDFSADELDAFLCAIQAAWAHIQRSGSYGVPDDVEAANLEGWIVDPSQLGVPRGTR